MKKNAGRILRTLILIFECVPLLLSKTFLCIILNVTTKASSKIHDEFVKKGKNNNLLHIIYMKFEIYFRSLFLLQYNEPLLGLKSENKFDPAA